MTSTNHSSPQTGQARRITTSLTPTYYKDFHCLAAACQDNCCLGLLIGMSKKDYLRLRRLDVPEDYKTRLNSAVRRASGDFQEKYHFYGQLQMENDRCPLLDDDSLCSLQKNCGGDNSVLPEACRIFPRTKTASTAAALEYSATLGCEGILQLLWELPDGVEFVEEELPRNKQYVCRPKAGSLSMDFPEIRSLCIDILQERSMTMNQRMLFLGIALQELHDMDWTRPDIADWSARTMARMQAPELLDMLQGNRAFCLMQNIQVAVKLHAGNKETMSAILRTVDFDADANQLHFDAAKYEQALTEFQETFGDLSWFQENIMVALAFHLVFPMLSSKEELWKSYVNLCNLYSFYRFAAIAGCQGNETKQQLFHILTMVSRALIHAEHQQSMLRDEFFQHDSATLAHMAILVNG